MRKPERVTHKPKAKQPDFAVQQAPAIDADLGTMVAKHMAGPGRMGNPIGNPLATRKPRFMEVPHESLQEMLNTVLDAQNEFRKLPARLKGWHNNDPVQFLRWLQNPDNKAEAIKLGLINPPEVDLTAQTAATINEIRDALKADPEANPTFKGGANAKAP